MWQRLRTVPRNAADELRRAGCQPFSLGGGRFRPFHERKCSRRPRRFNVSPCRATAAPRFESYCRRPSQQESPSSRSRPACKSIPYTHIPIPPDIVAISQPFLRTLVRASTQSRQSHAIEPEPFWLSACPLSNVLTWPDATSGCWYPHITPAACKCWNSHGITSHPIGP